MNRTALTKMQQFNSHPTRISSTAVPLPESYTIPSQTYWIGSGSLDQIRNLVESMAGIERVVVLSLDEHGGLCFSTHPDNNHVG